MSKNLENIDLFISIVEFPYFFVMYCIWIILSMAITGSIKAFLISLVFILFSFISLLIFNKSNTQKRIKYISNHIDKDEYIVKIKERIGIIESSAIMMAWLMLLICMLISNTIISRILTVIVLILCCLSMKIASNAFIRVFVITNKELFYISNDNKKIYRYIRCRHYSRKFYGGLYYSDIIDMKYFSGIYQMKTVDGDLYTFLGYIYPINKKDFELIKKLWRKRWSKKVVKKICNDYKKENIKIWSSYIKKVISDEKIKSDNEFALEDCVYGNSNIKLISAGDNKIQLIKEIRDMTGYSHSLSEIKNLINSTPFLIYKNINYKYALEIKQKLEAVGAIVDIETKDKQIKPNKFVTKEFAIGNNDIKLISAGDDIIQLIKEIRDIFGYGLADTYDLINSVPSIIYKNIDYDSALAIKQKLEATGAIISIENNNK